MSSNFGRGCLAALVLAGGLCGASLSVRAQQRYHDVPPPSPYDLPVPLPGLQTGPEEGEPIRPWRHWGDDHNDGEFVRDLLQPGGVEPAPPRMTVRQFRFCQVHPDQCRQ